MVLSFLILLSSNKATRLGIFVLKVEYCDCFEELYSKNKHTPLPIKLLLYGPRCTHYPLYLIIFYGFENQLLEIMNQNIGNYIRMVYPSRGGVGSNLISVTALCLRYAEYQTRLQIIVLNLELTANVKYT